jgi:hypothetical protein
MANRQLKDDDCSGGIAQQSQYLQIQEGGHKVRAEHIDGAREIR